MRGNSLCSVTTDEFDSLRSILTKEEGLVTAPPFALSYKPER